MADNPVSSVTARISENPDNSENPQAAADPVFAQEQEHLAATHAQLVELERITSERLEANLREAQEFKENSDDELSTDAGVTDVGTDWDVSMETYSAYAMMNNVVDSFNLAIDADTQKVANLRRLISKPYFAKVSLQFSGKPAPRDIYLGSVGAADEMHRQFIVDWRSPVAETYYNQQTGPMTYEANGRTVKVDLKLRRQFDVDGARLKSYFDTTVAIEDPMLLASLAARRGAQLQAITATIQREQNAIIRHADVPALLVRGVAGSGKTSVMLQRIAYLLFQQRATLNADQVYLVSPNPVFARYIKNVLPELGEKNPRTVLWGELMDRLGPGDRSLGADVPLEVFERIDALTPAFALEPADVREVRAGEHVLLSADQIWKCMERYLRRSVPAGARLALMVEEDLLEKLDRKVSSMVGEDAVQNEMLNLSDDEQERVFGHPVNPVEDDEVRECTQAYLDDLCAEAYAQVERGDWLRIDRIGMRMLGTLSLSAIEWIYLKVCLTGKTDDTAKFVMVDEVQDYSAGQLMVLARYFSRAHFLMLGDPNQAIRPGTASFEEIAHVFERARGGVQECALMTSYRATPEITSLFARLAPADEQMQISSVQPSGAEVAMHDYADAAEYRAALGQAVRAMRAALGQAGGGLGAVVVNTRQRLKWMDGALREDLGADAPVALRDGAGLPEGGVVLIDLDLAKGLEFDRVLIADAQAEEFPDEPLARRRLYTAISRATKSVEIIAQGELTPLL